MRFELFAIPALAALVDAAAISSAPHSSSMCTTCPYTIKNTDSAISSVMSQMSAQSPKPSHASTTTVIGSALASTALAPMTTAHPSSSIKTSTSKPKTTSKAKSSSSKKHQRRVAATTTTPSSSYNINSACATQPNYGYTYVPSPAASPSAFLHDNTLHGQSTFATVPPNYNWQFAALYASQYQNGYLGDTEMSSYNPTGCASICNANSACKGFTIYFERDPTLFPAEACANPAPQTNVRCAFYSQSVMEGSAVNVGQWRSSFAVVVTGANGYNKLF